MPRRKRHAPEEIVAKLRQVEVLTGQGTPVADALPLVIDSKTRASEPGPILRLKITPTRQGQAHAVAQIADNHFYRIAEAIEIRAAATVAGNERIHDHHGRAERVQTVDEIAADEAQSPRHQRSHALPVCVFRLNHRWIAPMMRVTAQHF